ncbi:unnamed protein product [Malus baccata var. baccata]
MKKLRLLHLRCVKLNGEYKHLPKELIWLRWEGCLLKSIPDDFFNQDKLVVLDMRWSQLVQVWEADDAIPKDLGSLISLQVLDLSWNVFHTLPSLSGLSKLETLRLHNCFNLRTIPDIPPNQVILPNSLEAPRLDKLLNPMTWTDMKRSTNLTADFGKNIIQVSLPPPPLSPKF